MTLIHSDTISGMTIFGDGTIALWSEGRTNRTNVFCPRTCCATQRMSDHNVEKGIANDLENGHTRPMTATEETIYNTLRGIQIRQS